MTDMRHVNGAVSPGPGSERTEVWPRPAVAPLSGQTWARAAGVGLCR